MLTGQIRIGLINVIAAKLKFDFSFCYYEVCKIFYFKLNKILSNVKITHSNRTTQLQDDCKRVDQPE